MPEPKVSISVATGKHPDPECDALIRKIEGAVACGAAELESQFRQQLDARLAVWLPTQKKKD